MGVILSHPITLMGKSYKLYNLNKVVLLMAFLDTHKAIERIIATGISKESAEAIVESVNTKNDDVATKADISALKTDISALRSELKTEISELRTEVKADISELRTEVTAINTNVKWLIAIVIVFMGFLLRNSFI